MAAQSLQTAFSLVFGSFAGIGICTWAAISDEGCKQSVVFVDLMV